ncbi:MAG: acyl-CoA thioesterase [Synechococcaceae cyanobacterium RL_1_2]|nr:acyl-CoA thioesterase [Synechococcaceae cyanobacterium RL_1_2]
MIHYYLREIYLQDTDAAGIVFFSRVLTLCHEAYEACLKRSGVDLSQLVAQGIILPIVATECQFKRPMIWGETMTFNLLPELLGENKFVVNYLFYFHFVLIDIFTIKIY